MSPLHAPFGVYVHIPFCASRCDYCDFATWTDRAHLIDQYVDACIAHLERERDTHDGVGIGAAKVATSVFFGGGTPSLIDPESLMRILAAINRASNAEVTVECNPDAASDRHMAIYAASGVNRLSFGVQSTSAHV